MTSQAIFTASEREILQTAPLLTGLAVSVCDTGFFSDATEIVTLINQLKNAQKDYPHNELIQSLFADRSLSTEEMIVQQKQSFNNTNELIAGMLNANKLAVKNIEEQAIPSEVEEYKQFVYLCGEKVALAAGGGILGRGERISEREASLLADIKSSLGLHSLGFLSELDLNENV